MTNSPSKEGTPKPDPRWAGLSPDHYAAYQWLTMIANWMEEVVGGEDEASARSMIVFFQAQANMALGMYQSQREPGCEECKGSGGHLSDDGQPIMCAKCAE